MAKITIADGTVFEGTPAEIVEMARAFEVSSVEAVVPTFKEGARVLTLKNGQFDEVLADHYGTVYADETDEFDPYEIYVVGDDGCDDYFRPQDLELITEEPEVEEAPLAVGDYAKITEGATVTKLAVGDVVKIDERGVAYDFRTSRVSDGETEPFDRKDLIRATAEEVSAFKAQTQEKAEANAIERKLTEVFTSNGRKVNEYREGDIVRYVGGSTVKGAFVEVVGVSDGLTKIDVSRFNLGICSECNRDLIPMIFVENRLDRN